VRFETPAADDMHGFVDWRRCVRIGLIGAAAAFVLVVLAIMSSPEPPPGSTEGGYTTIYTPPRSGFEVLLNHADGQAYATLAQDPSLARPEAFIPGAGGAPTFAGRPVLPYLLWALSLGQPDLLPMAFIVVEALAGGVLAFGAAAVFHATGRPNLDRLALATLAFPGAITSIAWLGQDALALGLALAALVLWAGARPRSVLAAGLFLVAGLTRETMLVLPAVILLYGWFTRGWRRIDLLLAAPFAAYIGWGLLVAERMGASTDQGVRRNLDLPFVGIARSIGGWDALGLVLVLLQLGLIGWSLAKPVSRMIWWAVLTYALAMTLTARPVWADWQAGVRVILPVLVLALVNLQIPKRPAELISRSAPAGIPTQQH
jgi:hypothetical protein